MPAPKVDTNYLTKGLTALSHAGSYTGFLDWFLGHFGACVIAGEFLINECGLSNEVTPLIQNQIDKIIDSRVDLFKEISSDPIDSNWEEKILNGLNQNLKRLRSSGHGIIYGALALKVLKINSNLATKQVVEGIARLLETAAIDRLDRYYGISDYDKVKVESNDNLPPYNSELDMIRTSFSELKVIYPDQNIGKNRYFFTGCKIHGITHAHALCILSELGYKELARKGYENHRLQIKLNRHVPPNPQELKIGKLYFPHEKSFWERDQFDPHHIKFPYSALSLFQKLPKEECTNYEKKVAILWSC